MSELSINGMKMVYDEVEVGRTRLFCWYTDGGATAHSWNANRNSSDIPGGPSRLIFVVMEKAMLQPRLHRQ